MKRPINGENWIGAISSIDCLKIQFHYESDKLARKGKNEVHSLLASWTTLCSEYQHHFAGSTLAWPCTAGPITGRSLQVFRKGLLTYLQSLQDLLDAQTPEIIHR